MLFTPNINKLRTLFSLATSLNISFKMFPLLALEASTGSCAIKRDKHLVRWWYPSPWFMNKSSWITVHKHYPLFLATRINGFYLPIDPTVQSPWHGSPTVLDSLQRSKLSTEQTPLLVYLRDLASAKTFQLDLNELCDTFYLARAGTCAKKTSAYTILVVRLPTGAKPLPSWLIWHTTLLLPKNLSWLGL